MYNTVIKKLYDWWYYVINKVIVYQTYYKLNPLI